MAIRMTAIEPRAPARLVFWAATRVATTLVATLLPPAAWSQDGSSSWSAGDHARVRLVDAGPSPRGGGTRLAGIEIALDPGYLTYWRSPGEAGVPSTASFAGSTNLKNATLLYPAPGRFSEDGVEAIGYENRVVFPVLVAATAADQPVTLALDLSFAICERLCLPAHAEARLTLGTEDRGEDGARVREALARVPAPAAVGEPGPLTISAVTGAPGDGSLMVTARTDGHDAPLLFAEAPDPWFVQAGPGQWSNDGSLHYTVTILSKPTDPAPLPLRLTLVGADAAIEVPFTLDAPPAKP